MFRLIRTLILVLIAFVAGVFYERVDARTDCEAANGTWSSGRCIGAQA